MFLIFPAFIRLSCGVGVRLFSILRSVHMTGHGQPVMETSMQCVGMVQGQVTGGTITTPKRRTSDTVNNLKNRKVLLRFQKKSQKVPLG